MTDPRDLAEAARQAVRQEGQGAAPPRPRNRPRQAKAPAKAAPAKPQTVPPKPTRELAAAAPPAPGRAAAASWSAASSSPGSSPGSSSAWITFTAALSAMTLMTVRFMFPNVLAEPPSTIKIGLPIELRARGSQRAVQGRVGLLDRPLDTLQRAGYHLRPSIGLHAPGLPAQLAGREQKFKCPCHGSGFYISGINFEGPAPRPLERFKVALADDGQIMVDKSQKFQQELGQWSDPDSFIPA